MEEANLQRTERPFIGLAAVGDEEGTLRVVTKLRAQERNETEEEELIAGLTSSWEKKEAHLGSLMAVEVSKELGVVVTTGYDNTVRFWDIETLSLLTELTAAHESSVRSANFGRNNSKNILATCSDDGRVKVWRMCERDSVELMQILEEPTECVFSVQFSLDGSKLAAGCDDGFIYIWSCKTSGGKLESEMTLQCPAPVFGGLRFCSVSTGDEILVSAHRDNHVRVWNVQTGDITSDLKVSRKLLECLATCNSENGSSARLATGADDGIVSVWDLETMSPLYKLSGHSKWVLGLCFVSTESQGTLLMSSGADGTVRLWDPNAGISAGILDVGRMLSLGCIVAL